MPIGMAIHELHHQRSEARRCRPRRQRRGRVAGPRGGGGVAACLAWTERGGPPVRVPTRQGFVSRLLQRVLATQLQGRRANGFRPGGHPLRDERAPRDATSLNLLSIEVPFLPRFRCCSKSDALTRSSSTSVRASCRPSARPSASRGTRRSCPRRRTSLVFRSQSPSSIRKVSARLSIGRGCLADRHRHRAETRFRGHFRRGLRCARHDPTRRRARPSGDLRARRLMRLRAADRSWIEGSGSEVFVPGDAVRAAPHSAAAAQGRLLQADCR